MYPSRSGALLLLPVLVLSLVPRPSLLAQRTEPGRERPSGFYLKGVYASISDPGFLDPMGGEDGPVVPQSRTGIAVGLGWESFGERGGFFAGVQYLPKRSFESFAYHESDFSQAEYRYQDPQFGILGFEAGGHWFPVERTPVSLYAVIDVATVFESYEFESSLFPQDNGHRSEISARPGIGVGSRLLLGSHLSLQLEYQLIVAASSMTYDDYLYSRDGYSYYLNSPEESTAYSKLFTVGIVVTK